ncbi:MAG TPA: L-serine ammonia-lyase, iron-sulfur-dependent, subunit alpha [Pyrinomonadaceae bacterium]
MKNRALPVLSSKGASDSDSDLSAPAKEGDSRYLSIIDNVTGPVGRGPSSSHTMAPYRAAIEAVGFLGGPPDFARVLFLNSFATTGKGHRSHIAVAAGLQGMDPEDPRFPVALEVARDAQIQIVFEDEIDDSEHPNTVYLDLRRGDKKLSIKVVSTGGGNYDISADCTGEPIRKKKAEALAQSSADTRLLKALPVLERALKTPRHTWRGFAELAAELDVDCAEFALLIETHIQINNGGLQTPAEVRDAVHSTLMVMLHAVEAGSQGKQNTQVTSGDWGQRLFQVESGFGNLWQAFAGAIAAQEYNAGMGVVAAAPTGGASGTLPGVLYGLMNSRRVSTEKLVDALLVAGLIGLVGFSQGPVSGAQSGCGGEIGIAAMMAAGAASHVLGGSWSEIDAAAALSGQLFVGLECSPAKGNVEYPCIPRNGFAALVAIAAAEAAAAGIAIPEYGLDATLDRIFSIGRLLPRTLRETEDGHWAASLAPTGCCGKGGCLDCPVAA